MPHDLVPRRQRGNAKVMRSEMTDAELKLWNAPRANRLMGPKFRRQVPVGPYIADFACPSKRLIVEADGARHGDNADCDAQRANFLQQSGWTVIRFWNHDILKDIDGVCQHIVTQTGHAAPQDVMPTSFKPQEHAS